MLLSASWKAFYCCEHEHVRKNLLTRTSWRPLLPCDESYCMLPTWVRLFSRNRWQHRKSKFLNVHIVHWLLITVVWRLSKAIVNTVAWTPQRKCGGRILINTTMFRSCWILPQVSNCSCIMIWSFFLKLYFMFSNKAVCPWKVILNCIYNFSSSFFVYYGICCISGVSQYMNQWFVKLKVFFQWINFLHTFFFCF